MFDSAFLLRDAAGARQWWERLEAIKPRNLDVYYWLAQSALHFIENRPEEASAAWKKGNALARLLPAAGAYDFDRYRFDLLYRTLQESPTADCIEPEISVASGQKS